MLRLGLSSGVAVLAMLPLAGAQPGLTCRNGRCEAVVSGSLPAGARLRINAHGPVTLQGGVAPRISYTIRVSADARTEAEARRILQRYAVRVSPQGGWTVLSTPGGAAMAAMTVRAPRLSAVEISTSDGAVDASGVEGSLDVDSGAGEVTVDRIGGDCTLNTGGGVVRVGQVGGSLHCTTQAGHITVKSVRGEAVLETSGGDILATEVGGAVNAQTGGGGVHIGSAGGAVSAISGGGEIVVDKAKGVVTVRNMAGPVRVGSAAGVRCDSGSGGIRVSNIVGPMRVSTSMGNILASLLGSRLTDSYLATGSGDITVVIPSNVGVRIQARNSMADVLRPIVSEFREIQVRRQGPQMIAEGAVNGGGPLLQISGMGGTILIKRQQ